MNIHSYTVIHYGIDYIPYALRSIYSLVDKCHIFYTPHPSHGSRTNEPCPETRDEIYNATMNYDPHNKKEWQETSGIWQEGTQRDNAVRICQEAGADIILVVDYDEIWRQDTLRHTLNYVIESNSARNWLAPMVHFWRSFDWWCQDEGRPVRIIDLRHNDGDGYIPKEFGLVFHFGYAISDKIMRYKWQIHGHRTELRQGWFEDKWGKWPPPPDCHPTNERDFWTPEPADKSILPEFMKEHPFYNEQLIR